MEGSEDRNELRQLDSWEWLVSQHSGLFVVAHELNDLMAFWGQVGRWAFRKTWTASGYCDREGNQIDRRGQGLRHTGIRL
jgi:hypothetical protein